MDERGVWRPNNGGNPFLVAKQPQHAEAAAVAANRPGTVAIRCTSTLGQGVHDAAARFPAALPDVGAMEVRKEKQTQNRKMPTKN